MKKNKAEARDHFGTKTNYTNGRSKQCSRFHYLAGGEFSRCQKCGSDYMRASIDGYCQRCLQQIEYASRERPDVLAAITNGGLKPRIV
jgi:predicted amidophosphoribosyltransferase